MKLDKQTTRNGGESGNALFLILIAVALFAALSYAITQSGRGGGDISAQTALITAGQVTEAPADTRAAISRMVLSGQTASSLNFGPSSSTTDGADVVFTQPLGGGAVNVPPPAAAMANTAADPSPTWLYVPATGSASTGNFVVGLGTANATTALGSDAFAVLSGTDGVASIVCQAIQKGLGFSTTVPPEVTVKILWGTGNTTANGNVITTPESSAYTGAASASTIALAALQGQDFACFNNDGDTATYVYYASLSDQ